MWNGLPDDVELDPGTVEFRRVEFPWSRSRRQTSQAAAEFFPRRRRRIINVQFFGAITKMTEFLVFSSFNIKKRGK